MAISPRRYLSASRESAFPNLTKALYHVTSDETIDYNCIAYAAGDETRWWWPDPFGEYYWPAGLTRAETLEAFIEMFASFGCEKCDVKVHETGFEKVAIYVDLAGTGFIPPMTPTHAARQIASGSWKSKLGGWEDIEHINLECLMGSDPAYGEPATILRRQDSKSD